MKIKKKITNLNIATLDANWVKYGLLCITVAFAFLYIWQVNVSATHGYAMRDLENDITDVRHQNERLQFEVSRLQSVDSVTNRVQMLGLTKIDSVNYVTVGGDSSVAINR